eukprot:1618603-Amphidinium_carterae.1
MSITACREGLIKEGPAKAHIQLSLVDLREQANRTQSQWRRRFTLVKEHNKSLFELLGPVAFCLTSLQQRQESMLLSGTQ